jgi:hypothetical protein
VHARVSPTKQIACAAAALTRAAAPDRALPGHLNTIIVTCSARNVSGVRALRAEFVVGPWQIFGA